ncbi:hypothetical protein FRC01_004947 [Tulasnella sp. 417]|nr:hypothetical protein FRC01_004947 [Tulasnella sp. 417]
MTTETEPAVVGYYRYTDIMFEWHKTCPEDSVEQLKAFMYPGCLTHPENPLVDGGEGLQIWQGTMRANNEIRLLYSSAQIEYIRYWLYEMGITPQKIPIPRSQYIYYHFGDSVPSTKKDLIAKINALLSGLAERGPLFVIFHDPTSDIKDLNLLHITAIKDMRYTLPDPVPTPGVYCIDTRKMFCALEGVKEPKSLSRICRILGLRDFSHFHNAGNDAEYTLQCFVSMAGGVPIDAQREARWPTRPGDLPPNVKREYARESRPEDESDWEDPNHPF